MSTKSKMHVIGVGKNGCWMRSVLRGRVQRALGRHGMALLLATDDLAGRVILDDAVGLKIVDQLVGGSQLLVLFGCLGLERCQLGQLGLELDLLLFSLAILIGDLLHRASALTADLQHVHACALLSCVEKRGLTNKDSNLLDTAVEFWNAW